MDEYCCQVWHELTEGHEDRERKLVRLMGRVWNLAWLKAGYRIMQFHCATLTTAQQMRDAAQQAGFYARARER